VSVTSYDFNVRAWSFDNNPEPEQLTPATVTTANFSSVDQTLVYEFTVSDITTVSLVFLSFGDSAEVNVFGPASPGDACACLAVGNASRKALGVGTYCADHSWYDGTPRCVCPSWLVIHVLFHQVSLSLTQSQCLK
jgi:hypothetical protein